MNAIITEKVGFEAEEQQVIEGTLTPFNSQVSILFDTSASNSFIAIRIIQQLGLVPQTLEVPLNVISPLEVSVRLGKVCKDCTLNLENRNLPIDLIVLSIKEFDVILGIDWLMKYHAKMDCVRKMITFALPRSQRFDFQYKPWSDTFLTRQIGRAHV